MAQHDQQPANRVIVVFGATGDLAARRLYPGLYRLFSVKGCCRGLPDHRLRPSRARGLRRSRPRRPAGAWACDLDGHWGAFAERLQFVASTPDDGGELARAIEDAEREVGAEGERLLYLSIPPGAMGEMVRMLGREGIAEHASLVIEKPFGHDLASAKELNATLHTVVGEDAIYRIDHFLGKEAAQNILALRFANGLLEPIWTRDHISYVQIDVPEAIDIQGRANFYEQTGAFRDMVVTHLLQILGIVALEPPSRIAGEALHIERTKLFEALRPLDPARVVFGQYEGYREHAGVAPDSQSETFAAVEVRVTAGAGAGFRSTFGPGRPWPRAAEQSRSASRRRR